MCYFKSAEFDFLWLILYNDFLIVLSVYALWMPGPNHVPGTTIGYYPGEFIIFTTMPLVLIGFTMKLIFLSKGKENEANPTASGGKISGGTFLYIFISFFPAWFAFSVAGDRLIKSPMWLQPYAIGATLFPIMLPILPRLYRKLKRPSVK